MRTHEDKKGKGGKISRVATAAWKGMKGMLGVLAKDEAIRTRLAGQVESAIKAAEERGHTIQTEDQQIEAALHEYLFRHKRAT